MKKTLFIAAGITVLIACNKDPQKPSVELNSTEINAVFEFQPNILWLVAEDQSPNIPSFGDSTIITPTLDRLAAEGVSYDNFFSPAPVCAPARAAIITGMYPNHIGASHMRTGPWVVDNVSPERVKAMAQYWPDGVKPYEAVPSPEVKMFTEYLRKEGYYCSNNAKEDYQFIKTMTAWDESSNEAHWRNRKPGQPFFSVFNFGVTHESQIWSKAEDSLWVDPDLYIPVPPYLPDTENGRKDVRRMYSNILEMDAQVGKILEQLEEDGLLDSTIVVWYTDHGGPLPRQKRLLHDSGLKVPMIIRFPNKLFAGKRDDRLISFIDLAPSMLSLAGINPPDYMDGSAFIGSHIRSTEPDYIFAVSDRYDAEYDRNRATRDKHFKYIRYYDLEKSMFLHSAYRDQMAIMQELYRLRDSQQLTESQALWFRSEKPEEELFDIENDPHELHNLADDPHYAEKLAELRQVCEEWVMSIDDTGLIPEKELLERFWPGQQQPHTDNPEIGHEGDLVIVTCSTAGASIGYKIIDPGTDPENISWSVYDKSIDLPAGKELIVKAHRIGFKPSEEVRTLK